MLTLKLIATKGGRSVPWVEELIEEVVTCVEERMSAKSVVADKDTKTIAVIAIVGAALAFGLKHGLSECEALEPISRFVTDVVRAHVCPRAPLPVAGGGGGAHKSN